MYTSILFTYASVIVVSLMAVITIIPFIAMKKVPKHALLTKVLKSLSFRLQQATSFTLLHLI